MKFLLVLNGEAVDTADTPGQLDFLKVSGRLVFEVCVQIDGVTYPTAAMNLAGYMHCADWVTKELCKELDFRRAMPDFEAEIKLVDGPIITFGAVDIGSDGRML